MLLISALCLTYSIILIQNSTRFSPMRHFGFSEGALGLWYLFSGLQLQISDVEIVIAGVARTLRYAQLLALEEAFTELTLADHAENLYTIFL